jgi:hypothetical protein
MHIEQVQFEEVFDVQAARGDFSFRTGGKPVYGVNLRHGFVPAAGSRYAVAFERQGDWSTVLAWRALGTQEVRFKEPGRLAQAVYLVDFLWFAPFFIGGGLAFAGPGGALASGAAFLALLALGAGWNFRRLRRIERALLAVGDLREGPDNAGTAKALSA